MLLELWTDFMAKPEQPDNRHSQDESDGAATQRMAGRSGKNHASEDERATIVYPAGKSLETVEVSGSTVTKAKIDSLKQQKRSFPVTDWDRYKFVKFIGSGGMGNVYQGEDLRLKRSVALKFLRGHDADLLERFLLEAQSQARIKHENICKVYEVGEVQSHFYIAMQYIDGPSLKEAKSLLTLTEKVEVIRDVAYALHAAHNLGLVHRDIKPANIMLEKFEDSSWQPYLMDFGLVREVESRGNTVTGAIVGTPAFMSPEQARGDVHKLDRRSDIFSIGATFYDLLTGQIPFNGQNPMEIMLNVMKQDAISLRKLNSEIPLDLETIVMKCLDKEPLRRYQTAKALAEDLQRFLENEPIAARPPSLVYLIAKRARKNKAALIASSIALILVISMGIMFLISRWRVIEQERQAQQFGQQVKEIEAILRYAYGLPLHNTKREKDIILARMKNIENRQKELGSIAEASGNYALGRGYIALHDYDKARFYLEKSWEQGYQTPEVKYALGQVLGELYKIALDDAQKLNNREARETRIKEIENSLREPALNYLIASNGAQVESATYIEGLIAFYEQDYEQALKKANDAFEEVPWLYEAKKLAGDTYVLMGDQYHRKGEFVSAQRAYEQAGEVYKLAIDMARSDASIYEGESSRLASLMQISWEQGNFNQSYFDEALKATDKALLADPESIAAYRKRSALYARLGDIQLNYGQDPRISLQSAIEMAMQLIKLKSDDYLAHNVIGLSYSTVADYELLNGQDPRGSLDRSIDSFQKSYLINATNGTALNNLGLNYLTKGQYEISIGIDPTLSLNLSIKNFNLLLAGNPTNHISLSNLGTAYIFYAKYEMEHGIDAAAKIESAIEVLQRSLDRNAKYAYAYRNMGLAFLTKSSYEISKDKDAEMSLDIAIDNLEKSVQINQNFVLAYNGLAQALAAKAQYQIDRDLDPTNTLSEANKYLEKVFTINSKDFEIYLAQGKVALINARYAIKKNQSTPNFELIERSLQKALALNNQSLDIYQTFLEFYRCRAEWRLQNRQSPQNDIQQAISISQKALAINASAPNILAERGAIYLLQSRTASANNLRDEALNSSLTDFQKAFNINPFLTKNYQLLFEQAKQMTK